MTTEPTFHTEPASLLGAMLAYIRREGCDAAEVVGYRERSYNIGYCETCNDLVTEVRIFYTRTDGTDAHFQVDYTDLGELIRKLTDDPGQVTAWNAQATRESDDERWDRWNVHSFDGEE